MYSNNAELLIHLLYSATEEDRFVSYLYERFKSIEVMYKNDDQKVLATVHFRRNPSVSDLILITLYYWKYQIFILLQDHLSEELIEEVKYNIKRSSPQEKLHDYLKWMKAAEMKMNNLVM